MESQHADSSYMPGLNDELALLCLAKTSRAEYGKLFSINKSYLSLSQSGDLYKMRRKMGICEHWVFMTSDQFEWRVFDPKSGLRRTLPAFPCDIGFAVTEKESLCVGTHLLVFGRDKEGHTTWRYELVSNRWFKGPCMIRPRYHFAYATCAHFAIVAGGAGENREILKSVEKYDPEKGMWEPLPDMIRARKLCSGFFMDNRFYVIGGTTVIGGAIEGEGDLTCGEFYDFDKKKWELISNMMPHSVASSVTRARPLVAVAHNELYALEAFTNQLKYYSKQTNKWKVLGQIPTDISWGSMWYVAFRSMGDHLFLMREGCNLNGFYYEGHSFKEYSIYTSCPQPNKPEANWHFVATVRGSDNNFVFSSAIMSA